MQDVKLELPIHSWEQIKNKTIICYNTSFLLSFDFCINHLADAWGDFGVHSRKAVLFFTPYCTDSTAFLYSESNAILNIHNTYITLHVKEKSLT